MPFFLVLGSRFSLPLHNVYLLLPVIRSVGSLCSRTSFLSLCDAIFSHLRGILVFESVRHYLQFSSVCDISFSWRLFGILYFFKSA